MNDNKETPRATWSDADGKELSVSFGEGEDIKRETTVIIKTIKFKTAKEMVCWLMDNEGTELVDLHDRRWLYVNFEFYFKDIGGKYTFFEKGLDCLHLYGTKIGTIVND